VSIVGPECETPERGMSNVEIFWKSIKSSRAYSCLECGKCTACCPVSRYNGVFSPRRVVAETIEGGGEGLISNAALWECLTCGMCEERCPMDVHFSEFMRSLRTVALDRGFSSVPSHGGVLQSLMRMMVSPTMKQDRMWWVTEDLEIESRGEILYFVGCLPYFDGLFAPDFKFKPTDIAQATVRILNAAGIQPVVDPNERCCGHDLLWSGDEKNFKMLAEQNVAAIRETGASVVVTACAECASTLRDVYPAYVGAPGFEVKHLAELVTERSGDLSFKEAAASVTFQDPCRLSRHMGLKDAPRQALDLVPGLTRVEMLHSGSNAMCCGTSAWMSCDQTSKRIQGDRLAEAEDTGADTLVTSCPFCLHMLSDALKARKPGGQVRIQDIAAFFGG